MKILKALMIIIFVWPLHIQQLYALLVQKQVCEIFFETTKYQFHALIIT